MTNAQQPQRPPDVRRPRWLLQRRPGLLSAAIKERFPDARVTLLDGAPAMLAQARELLGDAGVSYLDADLLDPLPAGPWDAIAVAVTPISSTASRRWNGGSGTVVAMTLCSVRVSKPLAVY